MAREAFESLSVDLIMDLPLPVERLRSRGIALGAPQQNEPEDTATEAEVDALIDRALAYEPEAEIEALTDAAEGLVGRIVAEAEAKGQTVHVIKNIPARAKKKAEPSAKS